MRRRTVYWGATLLALGVGVLAEAQELPCWKTINAGWTACDVWENNEAPSDYCPGSSDWQTEMTVYFATRASKGWTSYQAALFECSGTYYTGQECDELQSLNWQIAGSQATGSPCPSGPPQ